MNFLLMDNQEFKKLITKISIPSVYGSDSIEYTITGSNVRIVKAGNKLQTNREKPYEVVFNRQYWRFKTLKESLEFAQDLCWKESEGIAV